MLSQSLPAPFLRATLVALDLPHHLVERYAAPEDHVALDDRDRRRYPSPQSHVRQGGAPSWPFPAR